MKGRWTARSAFPKRVINGRSAGWVKPAKYRNNAACDQAEHLAAHLHPVPDRLGISMKDQILPVYEPVYNIKEITRDERDLSLDKAIPQFAAAIEEQIDRNYASDDFIK